MSAEEFVNPADPDTWRKARKRPVDVSVSEPFDESAPVWPFPVGAYPPLGMHPGNTTGICGGCGGTLPSGHGWIDTLEGGHIVCPGDRIIRGVKGEFYPIKAAIFEETYDPLLVWEEARAAADPADTFTPPL